MVGRNQDGTSSDERQPHGVVTLLLTDLVGSTRLWEAHPKSMAGALARHDALVAETVAAHGGSLIKTRGEGDATFSVFRRATDAAAAAVALQQAMTAEPWPEPIRMSVRVALHTGEVQLRDGDYFGTAVNRAARLRAVAGGGEILCSQATAGVLADALPEGIELRDSGVHPLKDLSRPEHIFTLVWPGAPAPVRPVPARPRRERPFVGRAMEMETAERCLIDALAGHGGTLLLAGEAGIGKTSLAERLGERARAAGAPVAWGRFVEEEGVPPFWAWRQVLRSCLAATDRERLLGSLGAAATDLSALAPELLSGDAGATASPAVPPAGEARFRLFESLGALLTGAAAPAGLVAVLDDLHWADPSSVSALAHLGRALASSRLLLVATYRDQEIDGDNPLSGTLASLCREPNTVRVSLEGLAEVEVADQLETTFGHRFEVDVVAGVTRRSRGNPFFVGEIGRLLDQERTSSAPGALSWDSVVPQGARDLIGRRLDRLPASCRELLRVAAVAGSTLEAERLAAVCRRPVGEVFDDLHAAAATGVIVMDDRRAEFVHALVRDTLAGEMPVSGRLEVHRLVATHLEAAYADSLDRHAASLAHHLLSALPVADARHAVRWAERAAAQAMDALAYEEAARLYERALAAAESAGFGPLDRSRLLSGRAEALYKCGDVTGAIASAGEAGDDARRADDLNGVARAVLVMEGVADHQWAGKAAELCEYALGRLEPGQEETASCLMSTLACQWSILASNYWDMEPATLERADAKSREALDLAERTGAPRALMGALRAREMVCAQPDRVHDRREVAERALRLATETQDPWAEHWGRLWRIDASCQLGDLGAAEADLSALRVVVARLRQPVAQWHLARTGGAVAAARGEFAEAALRLREATDLADRGLDPRAVQMSAAAGTKLALLTGDAEYEPYVERLIYDSDPPSRPMVETYLTLLYATRDQLELAAEHYRRMPPWPTWRVPHFVELIATHEYARGAALMGDAEGAVVAYERLLPWRSYFAVGGSGVVQIAGSVELALGCLAATTGRADVAIRHMRMAIEANRRAGMAPFEAEARYELAKVLTGLGDRDRSEALVLAADAAATAGRLGMRPLHDHAQDLADSLRAGAERSRGAIALTRREEEIAALVAKGLTNRQIAELLHISERTAENHVQHILTKLGFRTRSQVAAWAAASSGRARG